MKATIERAVLLKSLGHVQSVVERRNTIPILSNVLIEADASGQLKLMATDLDLQVVETVAARVETPGTTTVSAHTLFEIARKLPEGAEVSLSAAEGKMQVKAGRSNFNLPTLPRDDFPVIAEGDLPTTSCGWWGPARPGCGRRVRPPVRRTRCSGSPASCPRAPRSACRRPRARCRSRRAARTSTCRRCRATISR